MKFIGMLAAAAAFVFLSGCDTPASSLLSLETVVAEGDAYMDQALLGTWAAGSDNTSEFCVIRRDGDTAYKIYYFSGAPLALSAHLFKAGGATFLDVTPDSNDSDFSVPGHAIARVWITGAQLRWSFLDSDWLKQQASKLPQHTSDKQTVLLSSGPTVRALIAKSGADDQAHGAITTWDRQP